MSFSSTLFLFLACWPLFGNHLTRRGHIQAAKSVQQQTWLEQSAKARTFSQIGTSFLYKQEVLLFGLRDWVLDNWEKYRIQSQETNPLQANNQLVYLLTMTQIPFNVVKDITHVSLLRYDSPFILTGSYRLSLAFTSSQRRLLSALCMLCKLQPLVSTTKQQVFTTRLNRSSRAFFI